MNIQKALSILKLSESPEPGEIKRAYRLLALKYHPDRNPSRHAASLFQECTEAYNFLVETLPRSNLSGSTGAKEKSKTAPVENFEDIFDDIFGFTREDRILGFHPPQNMSVTLEELAYGAQKKIKLTSYEKCGACGGLGATPKTLATICTYCFGSGQIKSTFTGEAVMKLCSQCGGRGRKIPKPCAACDGYGRVACMRLQQLSIPQGMKPGFPYTIHSLDVKTGRAHDVFVQLNLHPHGVFQVESNDLLCEYPVSEKWAMEGGNVEVPTLWGWAQMVIPPGTKSGEKITLSGLGLFADIQGKKRGNLILTIKTVPDKSIKRAFKNLLQKVSVGNHVYPQVQPWWKRWFNL